MMAVPVAAVWDKAAVIEANEEICEAPELSVAGGVAVSVTTVVAPATGTVLDVCVNKLRRLVLSPPTPTAGTDPSSLPLPVSVPVCTAVIDEFPVRVTGTTPVAAEENAASVVAPVF